METNMKGVFTVDDIHELRFIMAEERRNKTHDEYMLTYEEEIASFKRRMVEIRQKKVLQGVQ
ncbi:MAG: hypothetical protein LBC96_01110 [Lachnospiraceae bacterium]|jgi:septum formation topological specificity factor MinE|nr:hypothetical protein [Lachnospiraceae bacterium]